jgi:hypothetical protein
MMHNCLADPRITIEQSRDGLSAKEGRNLGTKKRKRLGILPRLLDGGRQDAIHPVRALDFEFTSALVVDGDDLFGQR